MNITHTINCTCCNPHTPIPIETSDDGSWRFLDKCQNGHMPLYLADGTFEELMRRHGIRRYFGSEKQV